MSRETLQLARASSNNESQFDLQPVCTYFYRTCEKFPSRPAQRFNADLYHGDNNGRFTYAEMRERVESIACGILSLGLGRQDRVGIMSRPGPYWTHADMAVACCAGVSVTIYPTLSADEVAHILGDSGSRMVFVDTDENLGKVLSLIDKLPQLEKIIVMDLDFRASGERAISLGSSSRQEGNGRRTMPPSMTSGDRA